MRERQNLFVTELGQGKTSLTMNIVGKLFSNVKGFYNEINPATLTGAIDIVVIRQSDGTYTTSPWHVRFGKMGVIRARHNLVGDSSVSFSMIGCLFIDCDVN